MKNDSSLQISTRGDGLVVVTKYKPGTEKAFVSITSKTGSAHNPPDKIGLAHFFEHAQFKGTKDLSEEEIHVLLDRYALNHNAGTHMLKTTYYIGTLGRHLLLMSDLLFRMYKYSNYPEAEIEKEKEVVLNEIYRNRDNDAYMVRQELKRALYSQDHPMRMFTTGTEEGLANINREVLLQAQEYWHVPSNTIIIATGKVDHDNLCEIANKVLPVEYSVVTHPSWSDEWQILPNQKEHVLTRRNKEQAIIRLGCKLPAPISNDLDEEIKMDILTRIINDKLHKEVRRKRGLVYGIQASYGNMPGLANIFECAAQMLPQRIEETQKVINQVLFELPISGEDFAIAKDSTLDQYLISLEEISGWADFLSYEVIEKANHHKDKLNKGVQPYIEILESIQLEDILGFKDIYLQPERFAHAMMRPI